ncbi:MAG: transporter suffix domain-containing protein [Gammaproteobacteria bacterium]|nr:transporter suffix domain-containing protein [Gammaproteobacteria bacterium]
MTLKNGNLRYKLGIACIILSFVSPAITLIIPFFNFSTEVAVTLGTFFLIGLPEVFFVLGALLAGKKAAQKFTLMVKKWFHKRKKQSKKTI